MSKEGDEIRKILNELGRDAPELPDMPDEDEPGLDAEAFVERSQADRPQVTDTDPGSDLKEMMRELIDVAERIPEEVNSLLRA